jgi:hypothetical protein
MQEKSVMVGMHGVMKLNDSLSCNIKDQHLNLSYMSKILSKWIVCYKTMNLKVFEYYMK